MSRMLTGRHVLGWLAGFFAVVIAMNACFILLSVTTFRGEDEQKPYLQGVQYNGTLSRRAEQLRRGWRATVSAARVAGGHVLIAVTLKDREGRPLAGVPLAVDLRHPSDENRDRTLHLRGAAPGSYEADAGTISAGYWDVIVTGVGKATAPFEAMRRVWVP